MGGRLVLAEAAADPVDDLGIGRARVAVVGREEGTDDLTVVGVAQADDDGGGDGGVRQQPLLDLEGVDVFAACIDISLS